MEFEIVDRCGRIHVRKNGVEGEWFVRPGHPDYGDYYLVYSPILYYRAATLDEALAIVARNMETWYTVLQAAARLAELGKVTAAPERHTMYRWLRAGRFPGAIRIPGMRGRGHPWRIPGKALREFNRGGEKR